MATQISFSPYLGWVDLTDPTNIPADARLITASDLLRYENFGKDGAAAINAASSDAATAVTTANQAATDLSAHTGNTTNPHNVTKAQVGLGNVTNTADADKPVSTATQQALDRLAKGCLAENVIATDSPAIGTTKTVVATIASFTFKAGRNYRVVWDANLFPGSADVGATLTIATAATTDAVTATTGLTVLGARNVQARLYGVSVGAFVTGYFKPSADTTVQLKFLANIDGSAAGTSVTVQGSNSPGGTPARYRIYDDGAQF